MCVCVYFIYIFIKDPVLLFIVVPLELCGRGVEGSCRLLER